MENLKESTNKDFIAPRDSLLSRQGIRVRCMGSVLGSTSIEVVEANRDNPLKEMYILAQRKDNPKQRYISVLDYNSGILDLKSQLFMQYMGKGRFAVAETRELDRDAVSTLRGFYYTDALLNNIYTCYYNRYYNTLISDVAKSKYEAHYNELLKKLLYYQVDVRAILDASAAPEGMLEHKDSFGFMPDGSLYHVNNESEVIYTNNFTSVEYFTKHIEWDKVKNFHLTCDGPWASIAPLMLLEANEKLDFDIKFIQVKLEIPSAPRKGIILRSMKDVQNFKSRLEFYNVTKAFVRIVLNR